MTVFECTNQRCLVDDFSASSVHDDRALLELPDHLLVHHAFRVLPERDVHAKHVRLCEHLVEPGRVEVLAPVGSLRVLAARMIDNTHREGMCELGEAEADTAKTQNGKRASGQVVGVTSLVPRLPLSCAEVLLGVCEMAECGDHKIETSGGGRVIDCSWRVGDGDSYIVERQA